MEKESTIQKYKNKEYRPKNSHKVQKCISSILSFLSQDQISKIILIVSFLSIACSFH